LEQSLYDMIRKGEKKDPMESINYRSETREV